MAGFFQGLAGGVENVLGFGPQAAPRNAGANIGQGVTPEQVQQAAGTALTNEQQLAQLNEELGLQGGLYKQTDVYNQQQQLANALLAQSQGQGPNPAQAALNQQTGNNIASQAALMAGQRGSSANAGLLARQIAQQGAATQQQAVGQSATQQAQQQIAAQQQLQAQQQNMANLATTQAGQYIGGVNSAVTAGQNEQNILGNQLANYNNALLSNQLGAQPASPGVTALLGGLGAAAGKNATSGSGAAAGGAASSGAAGAGITSADEYAALAKGGVAGDAPNKKIAKVDPKDRFNGVTTTAGKQFSGKLPPHLEHIASIYHPDVKRMGYGGMADGAMVPGKAEVKGDSLKNDKVKALLSPKEIVLPRSVTMAEDAPDKAKAFVAELLNKYGDKMHGGGEDEFKSALKKAMAERRAK